MNYLLDTNVFLWWSENTSMLSAQASIICNNPLITRYLSLASIWELQIKVQLGKLPISKPLPTLIADQININGLRLLPIHTEHIFQLDQLPMHHRDPFDRLIIAQALHEKMMVLSSDEILTQYPIKVIW